VGNGWLRSLHSRQLRTAHVHTCHTVSLNNRVTQMDMQLIFLYMNDKAQAREVINLSLSNTDKSL
jgi:hypothetical protein